MLEVGAIVVAVALFTATCLIGRQQMDALEAHMNSDLKQKYGVTLNPDNPGFPLNVTDETLEKPRKWNVVFPDGTPAQYSIRFDPNTSEPFVITAPTPDQLEQNAKK